MNQISEKETEQLLKRAFYTIKQLQAESETVNEPIAVVGMSCRFPGGCDTPEKFWELIKAGKDAIKEVPAERFNLEEYYNDKPGSDGKIYIREAGFLQEDVAAFDARLFNLSPREVNELDPQQRILLELSWEALERAGLAISQLKDSKSGVFIGLISSEYAMLPRKTEAIGPYTSTGILSNLASGRIAHYFGFTGPAITLDTACSSSLVSVHLACESLRRKECDLALAGGMNLMLSPLSFVMLCKLNALAKDGRCKSFDMNADGYGRGEGGGIIVLKRLQDAKRDQDNILAVLKGSAINHDGASSGLTVPNGLAQEKLIRSALDKAKIPPEEVDYLEAHGTGTPLGDPIEIQAINQVFATGKRAGIPLYIGTVKVNIGHLEAAAGIAGIIKTILCLRHKVIPPHFHLKNLNPRINLHQIPIIIPDKEVSWNANKKTRTAGISSFGFSGTNAHLVFQEYLPPLEHAYPVLMSNYDDLSILVLSSHDITSLKQLVHKYLEYLNINPRSNLADICYTANTGRSHFSCRVAFLVKDEAQLKDVLNNFLVDKQENNIFHSEIKLALQTKVVYFFSNTIQIKRKACLEIYQYQAIFKESLDHCNAIIKNRFNWSLLEALKKQESQRSDERDFIIIFSIEYAFAKMWEGLNIKPAAVVGEGIGIFVAACIANILTLEKALECVMAIGKQVTAGKRPEGITNILNAKDISQPKVGILDGATGELIKKSVVMELSFLENQFNNSIEITKWFNLIQKKDYKLMLGFGMQNDLAHERDPFFSGEDCYQALLHTIAKIYCLGFNPNWHGFYKGASLTKEILPTYPFQRKRFWLDTNNEDTTPSNQVTNSIKGMIISSPLEHKQIRFVFNLENYPDLRDTHNTVHVGYYYEMIKNSIADIFRSSDFSLVNFNFRVALVLNEKVSKTIHLVFEVSANNKYTVKIYSKNNEMAEWILHADGLIELGINKEVTIFNEPLELIKKRCNELIIGTDFYQGMDARGVHLGKSVQWIHEIKLGKKEALVTFKPILKSNETNNLDIQFPLGILDACAQAFNAALLKSKEKEYVYMMTQWSVITFVSKAYEKLWCHVLFDDEHDMGKSIKGSFALVNERGEIIVQCVNCEMKAVNVERVKNFRKISNDQSSQVYKETDLLNNILSISKQEHLPLIEKYLKKVVAMALRIPVEDFKLDDSLRDLGIDSLAGLDLKACLDHDLKIDLAMETIIYGHSTKELAKIIYLLLTERRGNVNSLTSNKDLVTPLWVDEKLLSKTAKLQLFCLPYGGGGASLYAKWKNEIPANISVIPIQLPGRENRIDEPPIDNIEAMLEELEKVFITLPKKVPFAIYGHSAGALIAFRLAHRLRANEELSNNLKHLFVGGYTAPHFQPNPFFKQLLVRFRNIGFSAMPQYNKLKTYSDEKLIALMNLIGMQVQPGIEKEMARTFLPAILSDLKIVGEYKYLREHMIDIPITAFHGEKDDRVALEGMKGWQKLTNSNFDFHVLCGDHFFMHKDQSQKTLIEMIVKQLNLYMI